MLVTPLRPASRGHGGQTASMIQGCACGADTRKIITVWELILSRFLVGCRYAFDVPISAGFFLLQMVGRRNLPNA